MLPNICHSVTQDARFASLLNALQNKTTAALFGAHPIVRCLYAASLARAAEVPVVYVTATDREAAVAAADLSALGIAAAAFPSRDFTFLEVEGLSHDLEQSRLGVLGNVIENKLAVVCCSVEALCAYTIPKRIYKDLSVRVEVGGTLDLKDFCRRLVAAGYTRCDRVDGRGQFAVRGGIVDVFPVHMDTPLRIELFGDEIDAISTFDEQTQRRNGRLERVFVTPAREMTFTEAGVERLAAFAASCKTAALKERAGRDLALLKEGIVPPCTDRYVHICYENAETLLDYLQGSPLMLNESGDLLKRHKNLISLHSEDLLALEGQEMYHKSLGQYYCADFALEDPDRGILLCDVFTRRLEAERLSAVVNIESNVLPGWSWDLSLLCEDLAGYRAAGYRVVVLTQTDKAAKTLVRDLEAKGYPAAIMQDDLPAAGHVAVASASLSGGFEIPALKLAVISAGGTATAAAAKKRRKKEEDKAFKGLSDLSDLHVGDLVVHQNHGIGMFDGIHRIDHHGFVRDYIKLKYRGADTLYVPVTQLDMVSLYISPKDNDEVKLAKLNSGEWNKTKQTVYRAVREMAKELIELYAKRERAEGIAFGEDGEWQRDFEARFPYEETGEQLLAVQEIKSDMQRARPMDRLLCGDVGVGKTEVALRAAFKCVTEGYQCAVLVPTTILAWQHFRTFTERMEAFPIKIAMLSRFATAKEVRAAVEGIRKGTVDIVIGTHRLLQKDIQFKRLGLLIIDEEQRFGVAHKEKLKQTFEGVDVLTLSATPIPRTLNMAMSGIRDMSVIEEPPVDRHPVQTYVLEHDDAILGDAIKRELSRGGQVYYLHNRVDSIERTATKLAEQFPDAHVETAHGKMSEEQLSAVWRRLIDGEIDILVCTTIIETGVDVPNCNTLVVENADHMGLSQLYQLRGRVGRSGRRAFAYFTFKRDKVITEVASKRLSAIRDFTSFGSGFRIAMRDLQIRGAGSVLSARQSGHMQAVGYDTYLRILEDAIDDEKGVVRHRTDDMECTVDLAINAYIPDNFIADNETRIEMYKKVAAIRSVEDREDVLDEFGDRFGIPPRAVENLCTISLVRELGRSLGFYEVTADNAAGTVTLYGDNIDPEAVQAFVRLRIRKTFFTPKGKACVTTTILKGETAADAALDFLLVFRDLCSGEGPMPEATPLIGGQGGKKRV